MTEIQSPQPVPQPIGVEVVGVVRDLGGDDGPTVEWLLEGGLHAVAEGGGETYLLVSHRPITDDEGHGEVYTLPPVTYDLTEARNIVVDAIRRMRAGHVACLDLTNKAEDFLQATHAAAKPDELWTQTLEDRDRYHEVADSLAQAIAKHLEVDIGEHSSANCPWDRALEALDEAAIPAPEGAQALTDAQIERAWRLGFRHACDAERLNANEEWGYKGANVIEEVAALAAQPDPSCPHTGQCHPGFCPCSDARRAGATAPAAGDELPPLPEPWIRDMTCAQPESRDHFAADQMHEYARAAIAADRAARSQNQPAEEWYCETHPEHLMGHDGCGGAGILESCRVHMLANQLRLARQEVREAQTYRDDLIMSLRAALAARSQSQEQERKDAERYRAIRDDKAGEYAICEWVDGEDGEGFYRDGRAPEVVDAAIDAAISAAAPGTGGSQP